MLVSSVANTQLLLCTKQMENNTVKLSKTENVK